MSGQRPGSGNATAASPKTQTTDETNAQPATTPSPQAPAQPSTAQPSTAQPSTAQPSTAQPGGPSALAPGHAPAGSSPAGLNGASPVVGVAVAAAFGITVMANGHQGPGGEPPASWTAPMTPPAARGHGQTQMTSWVFPAEPAAAARARRVTREAMLAWGAGDDTDVEDVVLMVDELVTNAVVHGCGPVTLLLRVEAGVLVGEVTDRAQTLPDLACGGDKGDWGRESGRGLWLVSVLAADHGLRPEAGGKTLWFTRLLNH